MVLHLYSAFSRWMYSNALYNTVWGPCQTALWRSSVVEFTGAPQNKVNEARPQHRELHALLFSNSVWVL